MMYLSDVRDLIKVIYPEAEHYYIGKLDSKMDKSIGVYSMRGGEFQMPVGGLENKQNGTLKVSLLVHWNKNSSDTEKASYELFKKLIDYRDDECYTKLLCDYPIDLGTDSKGVYERVIELEWYFNFDADIKPCIHDISFEALEDGTYNLVIEGGIIDVNN